MSNCKLIIFDCDGVLVDSETIANQVFVDMLGELGLSLTLAEAFEQFVGYSKKQCLDKAQSLLGKPLPEDFAQTCHARTKIAFESSLMPVPGIKGALDSIHLPKCVASNSGHEHIRTTLGLTGLLPRFDGKIFSSADVANPKPAPDVYLHAASKCGASAADCLVVEDTPAGVAAAVAAGMTVLGFAALTPAHRLRAAGAHRVFDRMADLPQLIRVAQTMPDHHGAARAPAP